MEKKAVQLADEIRELRKTNRRYQNKIVDLKAKISELEKIIKKNRDRK